MARKLVKQASTVLSCDRILSFFRVVGFAKDSLVDWSHRGYLIGGIPIRSWIEEDRLSTRPTESRRIEHSLRAGPIVVHAASVLDIVIAVGMQVPLLSSLPRTLEVVSWQYVSAIPWYPPQRARIISRVRTTLAPLCRNTFWWFSSKWWAIGANGTAWRRK